METKLCSKCQDKKDLSQFTIRDKRMGRKHVWCKSCVADYDKARYNSNEAYRNQVKTRNVDARQRNRRHVKTYLESHPCEDCGEDDPVVLDFDHRDAPEKEFPVSHAIHSGYSLDTIDREIAKCAVRCANCHRRRTARQFGWYKLST